MPDEQAAAVDAEALETGALSAWVAERRTAALDAARAREEEALESWVGARAAESPPKPAKLAKKRSKASTSRRPSGHQTAKMRKPRKLHTQPAPAVPAIAEPLVATGDTALVPEPRSDAATGFETSRSAPPEAVVVSARPTRWRIAVRQARLALAWYTWQLVQKAGNAVRRLAHGFAQLAVAAGRTSARCVRVSMRLVRRAAILAVTPLVRFSSELDLLGRIGLVLAVSGVAAAIALSLSR